MDKLQKNTEYKKLVERIGYVYDKAKSNVISAVNIEMLSAYWEIGKYIVEYEQKGKLKADYGSALLVNISKDLKLRYGKGFSRSNIGKVLNMKISAENHATTHTRDRSVG